MQFSYLPELAILVTLQNGAGASMKTLKSHYFVVAGIFSDFKFGNLNTEPSSTCRHILYFVKETVIFKILKRRVSNVHTFTHWALKSYK